MGKLANLGRIELKLPNDPRALSAVAGAVEHMAQRAGFLTPQQKELAVATEAACQAVFRRLHEPEATLMVIVEEYADRVEVTLEHTGDAPSADGNCRDLLARMDRVDYRTANGLSRWTLIKYAPARTAQP
jgi:anti-sigma regulatory factor (Ser/Thr protein kinase)